MLAVSSESTSESGSVSSPKQSQRYYERRSIYRSCSLIYTQDDRSRGDRSRKSASNSYRMEGDEEPMRTILVIGASGFVGRHLIKALLAEGPHDPLSGAGSGSAPGFGCRWLRDCPGGHCRSRVDAACDGIDPSRLHLYPHLVASANQRCASTIYGHRKERTAERRDGVPVTWRASRGVRDLAWNRARCTERVAARALADRTAVAEQRR